MPGPHCVRLIGPAPRTMLWRSPSLQFPLPPAMTPPVPNPSPGGFQRDILAQEERFTTLTCPSCQSTLRINADQNAEAPCPVCSHPLKYEAPAPTQATAFPPQPRQTPGPLAPVRPIDPTPTRHRRKRRSTQRPPVLRSPFILAGSAVLLTLLLIAGVVFFFRWDQDRNLRRIRASAIKAQTPPPTRDSVPVPLLPNEPRPIDTRTDPH